VVRITEILCLVSVIRLIRSRPDREAVRAKTWTREPVDACVRVLVELKLDLYPFLWVVVRMALDSAAMVQVTTSLVELWQEGQPGRFGLLPLPVV
jgi:hypothetical protein